jgi:hypothetical protein
VGKASVCAFDFNLCMSRIEDLSVSGGHLNKHPCSELASCITGVSLCRLWFKHTRAFFLETELPSGATLALEVLPAGNALFNFVKILLDISLDS